MGSGSGKNRRRHIRVTPEGKKPITVQLQGTNFLDTFTAFDISEGGIGLLVPHRFKGCDIDHVVTIAIELPLPVKKLFTLRGQIRHVADKKFGIEFVELENRQKEYLHRYVHHMLRNEPWWTKLGHTLGLL